LAFVNLPDGGIPSGSTAVVGSDVCLFYPIASVSSMDDLNKLPRGEKNSLCNHYSFGRQT